MPNGTYGGVRGRKTKVGRKLLRFPPTRCKFVTDYRTFMKDFLKVVDFVHYLRAEGYDMVTFDKVGNGIK